jgi:hypothetical protein
MVKFPGEPPMALLMGTEARSMRAGFSGPALANAKENMDGQLVAGQWVEVSMEDLPTPVLLSGFVLSLRPGEILLTFPDLLEPPEGLESEAQATVRYSNPSGSFTASGLIVRVASGPPVTVTFKRLVLTGSDPRRAPARSASGFPVSLHIVSSRVAPPVGPGGIPGTAQDLREQGVLLKTSLLLAVGDTVRLVPSDEPEPVGVQGRVVRVYEGEGEGQFGVGVEFVYNDVGERERWLDFAAKRRRSA